MSRRLVPGPAMLVVLALAGCGAARRSAPVTPHACGTQWVASWAASPSDASSLRPRLQEQTLRMIVAPHLGGGTLRVHLSNRYGAAPVTLGPVSVAAAGDGAAVQPGTLRPVRFAGAPTVTIPPGGEAVSDPVALAVAPFAGLAVSVFVPGSVPRPTEHVITRQRSWLTPPRSGDHVADLGPGAFAKSGAGGFSTGWYFLDAIDVLAPQGTGAVVAFGDSLTDGFQGEGSVLREQLAGIDANARYPDDLARRLRAAGVPLSVVDEGIIGDQLLVGGRARFAMDGLRPAGVSDVIVLEGINDIGADPGIAASRLVDAYRGLVAQAHAAGVRIQLGTLTPDGGARGPQAEAVRREVNAWIRGQHVADGVVDFDAAVRDRSDSSRLDPAYDGSDHVHLDPAGYRAMADAVELGALARPSCA
jgi:lysophospholipase L1-like esterase